MPIIRCKDQSYQTLTEFYEEVGMRSNSIDIGRSMLQLIERLNAVFHTTEVYVLTSLYNLVILSENTWKSKWVTAFITNGNEYIFYEAYRSDDPTPRLVYVSESELISKILETMKQSGYWSHAPELKEYTL